MASRRWSLLAVGGERLGIGDGFAEVGGQTVAAADDVQTDAFVEAMGGFGEQIFLEDFKNRGDFGGGPLPVRGREREESEGVNAEMRRAADDAAGGLGAGAMAGGARQGAGGGPAAVAVADDGDVQAGKPPRG